MWRTLHEDLASIARALDALENILEAPWDILTKPARQRYGVRWRVAMGLLEGMEERFRQDQPTGEQCHGYDALDERVHVVRQVIENSLLLPGCAVETG